MGAFLLTKVYLNFFDVIAENTIWALFIGRHSKEDHKLRNQQ